MAVCMAIVTPALAEDDQPVTLELGATEISSNQLGSTTEGSQRGISISDPGAVPGVSTNLARQGSYGGRWGRNSFDVCGKDVSFARHCTAVIGLFHKCQR